MTTSNPELLQLALETCDLHNKVMRMNVEKDWDKIVEASRMFAEKESLFLQALREKGVLPNG
jgi:hypothetical protein